MAETLVVFAVEAPTVGHGQSIRVVGNVPQLGMNDVSKVRSSVIPKQWTTT